MDGQDRGPWRDLPERFGLWNTVWKRFDRWAHKGRWEQIFGILQDPDLEWLILDSTLIRAPHAAGAKKGATAQPGRPSKPSAAAGAASQPRSTPA